MAATISRLVTKRERITEADGQELRRLVAGYPGLTDRMRGELIAEIDRRTASKNGWSFVMLSPEQNLAVVTWIMEHSKRPLKAVLLWAKCFTVLRMDTGEIMRTREELAEMIDDTSDHVSQIMGELVEMGAIIRRRQRVAGLRGPGLVQYFMNPRIGTHLSGVARDKAQAEAPLLKLMEGGKANG